MADSTAPPKIRHEWYQSDNEVVLSVFVKNVKEEDLTVDLAERSLSLNIKLPNDSEIAFDIDPLARSIDVSRSTHRVLSMKLEFKLAKKQAGARWTALEGDEEPADANTSTPAAPSTSSSTPNHAYPSSSKTKKNWDALAADFEKKEADEQAKRKDDKDANAGGDKELNELFKSLYAGATDDQRRAMIKSYQESNGTSLSTSWDEVKKGKVETRPPDSMVAKKWEQ